MQYLTYNLVWLYHFFSSTIAGSHIWWGGRLAWRCRWENNGSTACLLRLTAWHIGRLIWRRLIRWLWLVCWRRLISWRLICWRLIRWRLIRGRLILIRWLNWNAWYGWLWWWRCSRWIGHHATEESSTIRIWGQFQGCEREKIHVTIFMIFFQ